MYAMTVGSAGTAEIEVIRDRREMLKVKVKSLAEEARIIRKEERKTHGLLREELRRHRVFQVRQEARATHLAYGLVKGHPVERTEPVVHSEPDWKRVEAMVRKYGNKDIVVPTKRL